MYPDYIRSAAEAMAENMEKSEMPLYGESLRLPDRKAIIAAKLTHPFRCLAANLIGAIARHGYFFRLLHFLQYRRVAHCIVIVMKIAHIDSSEKSINPLYFELYPVSSGYTRPVLRIDFLRTQHRREKYGIQYGAARLRIGCVHY